MRLDIGSKRDTIHLVNLTMVNSLRERALGKATGDILKAIHWLQDSDATRAVALPSDIATRTGTSRAFVTKMLQTMSRQGLVAYSRVAAFALPPKEP